MVSVDFGAEKLGGFWRLRAGERFLASVLEGVKGLPPASSCSRPAEGARKPWTIGARTAGPHIRTIPAGIGTAAAVCSLGSGLHRMATGHSTF